MGDVTIPHTFTNGPGNVIDATQVNANFVALRDGVNDLTIDNLASILRESLVPAGAYFPFAGSAAPSGYLLCDGSAVSRTTYAALFTAIGTAYGVGDGSTTFNLPNMKGRVPVGLDAAQTEFDTRGETVGAKEVALSEGQLAGHAHSDGSLAAAAHAHAPATAGWDFVTTTANVLTAVASGDIAGVVVPAAFNSVGDFNENSVTDTAGPTDVTGNTGVTGSGLPHSNIQPSLVANYVIKT